LISRHWTDRSGGIAAEISGIGRALFRVNKDPTLIRSLYTPSLVQVGLGYIL
jgi:hypothetical protein